MDLLLLIILISGTEGAVLFSPLWMPKYTEENELFKQEREVKVCRTKDCVETAKYLMSSMNRSVDPCTNFFQFSCGGWNQEHPVPKTESRFGQFDLVAERLVLQLKDLLEEAPKEDEPGPVKSAKLLYKTCMEKDDSNSDIGPLLELLNEFGHWPMTTAMWSPQNFSWPTTVADMSSKLTIFPIVFAFVQVDRKNVKRNVLTFDQPSFVIPRTMLGSPQTYHKQIEAYKTWAAEMCHDVSTAAGSVKSKEEVRAEVEEFIEFEMKLAQLASPTEMRRNVLRIYNPMTLRQLQDWTDSSTPDQINWLHFLQRFTKDQCGIKVDWTETIIVREVDYLFKMVKLVKDTPERVISNYLMWRIISSFSGDVTKRMKELTFNFHQVFTGASLDQPEWKKCIDVTSNGLGMAVGYSYVLKHFDLAAKSAAVEMTNNIKSVFSDELSKLEWMDEPTKIAAKHKVEAMETLIGYPTWFDNSSALEAYYDGLEIRGNYFEIILSTRKFKFDQMMKKLRTPHDGTEWHVSPADVNAYYKTTGNQLLFPAGVLQPPFFNKNRLQALNYGSIGVVIGHEVTHGFDDMGRHSDAQGNLAQWWSETTIETYLKKTECFVEQYGRYRVPSLDKSLLTKVTVNGVTTLGENIADNGGLHAALEAYRRYVAAHGPEPRLPGLESFSVEQLFFIAFATNWCESSTEESLLYEILNDPHSPNEFRVLGSLENSEEFDKAFNCPKKKAKCTLW